MSEQDEDTRETPIAGAPSPDLRGTPTMRLGSMLRAVRAQSKEPEERDYQSSLLDRGGDAALLEEDFHSLDRIPRRRMPLVVFAAAVALAVLGAATRSAVNEFLRHKAPISSASQAPSIVEHEAVGEEGRQVGRLAKPDVQPSAVNAVPRNSTPSNAGPTNAPPTDGHSIETGRVQSPRLQASHVGTGPAAGAQAVPLPQGRPSNSGLTWRAHANPLRGYAWSPTANALVQTGPEDPGVPAPGPSAAPPEASEVAPKGVQAVPADRNPTKAAPGRESAWPAPARRGSSRAHGEAR